MSPCNFFPVCFFPERWTLYGFVLIGLFIGSVKRENCRKCICRDLLGAFDYIYWTLNMQYLYIIYGSCYCSKQMAPKQ